MEVICEQHFFKVLPQILSWILVWALTGPFEDLWLKPFRYEDFTIFSSVNLALSHDHFHSPCWWKLIPQYDAATTLFHCVDDVLKVRCNFDFLLHIVFCTRPKKFNFSLIWPGNRFAVSPTNSKQDFLWLSFIALVLPLVIKARFVECPVSRFSHLSCGSLQLSLASWLLLWLMLSF